MRGIYWGLSALLCSSCGYIGYEAMELPSEEEGGSETAPLSSSGEVPGEADNETSSVEAAPASESAEEPEVEPEPEAFVWFEDDFETGPLTAIWDDVSDFGARAAFLDPAAAFTGSGGLRTLSNDDVGESSYVTSDRAFNLGEGDTAYIRFRFRQDILTDVYTVPLLLYSRGVGPIRKISFDVNNNANVIFFENFNGTTTISTGNGFVVADQWYCVEIKLKFDDTEGEMALWIDEVLIGEHLNHDPTDGTNINALRMGGIFASGPTTSTSDITLDFDDFIITDTRPGC